MPIVEPSSQGQFPSSIYLYYTTKVHEFLCLVRTNIHFVWDEQVQAAFDALKQALTSAPRLSPPNFTKEFILYVSAYENAIIGVLVQEDDAFQ